MYLTPSPWTMYPRQWDPFPLCILPMCPLVSLSLSPLLPRPLTQELSPLVPPLPRIWTLESLSLAALYPGYHGILMVLPPHALAHAPGSIWSHWVDHKILVKKLQYVAWGVMHMHGLWAILIQANRKWCCLTIHLVLQSLLNYQMFK